MTKILISYQVPKEGIQQLESQFDIIYPENKLKFDKEEIEKYIPEVDGLLSAGLKVDSALLEKAAKLKIIANYGVGYDNIDVKSATKKGIVVTNTPETVIEATAEIAFGLMLAIMRRIAECDRKLRTDPDFKWGMMRWTGRSLYGKTLGIIGFGNIGRSVAKRALASGMKVLYHKRNRLPEKEEKNFQVNYATFEGILAQSDVISLHAPFSKETHHLIGENELQQMKPSVYLINTSRGPVVDEDTLVRFLQQKKIAGAALDVFEKEPQVHTGLLKLDNVVITPHIGTEAFESRIGMGAEASKNLIAFFAGQQPPNQVN